MSDKPSVPLIERTPRAACIVVMVMPGPPPYVQIDYLNTGAPEDKITGRYTGDPKNTLEATAAFEMFLSGTLWGQPAHANVLPFRTTSHPT